MILVEQLHCFGVLHHLVQGDWVVRGGSGDSELAKPSDELCHGLDVGEPDYLAGIDRIMKSANIHWPVERGDHELGDPSTLAVIPTSRANWRWRR